MNFTTNPTDAFTKVHTGLDRAVVHAARLKEELRRVSALAPDSDMVSLVNALLTVHHPRIVRCI